MRRNDSNFDSANLHVGNISQPEAAKMLNVSTRMVASVKAIESGKILFLGENKKLEEDERC